MKNHTFIEFVIEIVTNQDFIKQDDDHKNHIYRMLQESYDLKMESQYTSGHNDGYIEGMKKARAILKGE